MKALQVALVIVVPAIFVWGTYRLTGPATPTETGRRAPIERPPDDGRLTRLEEAVERLAEQLSQMELELAMARSAPRETVSIATELEADGTPRGEGQTTPTWYLEQYVASFRAGGEGSEYFRLAVEAYAPSLLTEIFELVTSRTAHPVLRLRLVQMLGDPRFEGSARVVKVLVGLVGNAREEQLVMATLAAIGEVADSRTAPALERIVWRIRTENARAAAIRLIVQLAGDDANRSVLQLLRTAPDERMQAFLISLVQPSDMQTALDVFRMASIQDKVVRLQAAHRIELFRDEAFIAFVDEWIGRETDQEVRAVLGAAKSKLSQIPSWHPNKAAGPPDAADPMNDSPSAWATQQQNGGAEWIELTYDPPLKANRVRIFEVLAAGAVAEVVLVDTGGGRHSVWKGQDPTTVPGVFEVNFQKTSYPVKRVRLILDTARANGWNEIDAVQLVGPGASAWAKSATASSYYGQGH